MEKAELEKLKNAHATRKPLNLDGKFGNDSGDLCQIVQQNAKRILTLFSSTDSGNSRLLGVFHYPGWKQIADVHKQPIINLLCLPPSDPPAVQV
jgi:hypothetical protein